MVETSCTLTLCLLVLKVKRVNMGALTHKGALINYVRKVRG